MNHRELVLSAEKKAKFAFLGLPEALQDDIIDALDGHVMGLVEASALVKSKGHPLSHEAIASYYRAVRRERRLLEVGQELKRIIADFGNQPYEEGLKSLANLIIATAMSGLADGSVGVKDIDLGKVLKALPADPPGKPGAVAEQTPEKPAAAGLSVDAADQIRREILGIKKD